MNKEPTKRRSNFIPLRNLATGLLALLGANPGLPKYEVTAKNKPAPWPRGRKPRRRKHSKRKTK